MVKVLKSGFYSSIQDLGRYGFQQYGVPVSGAMDAYSASIANKLLGNIEKDAVLEITMTGPKLQFMCDTSICIVGAKMNPSVNSKHIKQNSIVHIKKDDILSFGKLEVGFRTYLAVKDGFKTEALLSSRSMYNGITDSNVIKEGHVLPISDNVNSTFKRHAKLKIDSNHFDSDCIEVFKGPEFDELSESQKSQLLSTNFSIAKENSRMAYQLNETIDNSLNEIITSVVIPGTVQLTPAGKLIILMRDAQVTGGYPRVLQLSELSINRLSQKYTGKDVSFKLVE